MVEVSLLGERPTGKNLPKVKLCCKCATRLASIRSIRSVIPLHRLPPQGGKGCGPFVSHGSIPRPPSSFMADLVFLTHPR